MFKILGISGSLRVGSLNSMLLRAVQRLAPSGINVDLYRGLGALPLFNPDLEALGAPPEVAEMRSRIISSHALLIASPEYAHGVSGVIKNALDWMVGNDSFVGKPIGLLSSSPRASIAQAALRETLTTMSARVVPAASVVQHPETRAAILGVLRALQRHHACYHLPAQQTTPDACR
jgi:chromate reductase, NAD(P)H dehydrogenase (quinone)